MTLENIISIAIWFYENEDISFYGLVKDSGYLESHKSIHEDDIARALLDKPEAIDSWLEWSENKRSSEGWYFLSRSNGKYVVGKIDSENEDQKIDFMDKRNACALFIKRELDELL